MTLRQVGMEGRLLESAEVDAAVAYAFTARSSPHATTQCTTAPALGPEAAAAR